MPKTFREATDMLSMTGPELAELFGVSAQTIRQCRMDPNSRGYRTPPTGWEKELAKVAKARAAEITRLARELERA